MKTLVSVALLALAYWGVGLLALTLAIPPGFASAIFPPVGIAVGAVMLFGVRLLPGVFLGSLLLNITVGWQNTGDITSLDVFIAVGIALSTSAAALLAKYLSSFILKGRAAFTREADIASLLILTGPVACLTSATGSVAILYGFDAISAQRVAYSWWTWWIGDSIGVMLALPAMYIAFAEPRAVWRGRITNVGLPIAAATALMIVVFFRINHADLDRLNKSFQQLSIPFAANFQSALESHIGILKSIDGLFQASDNVSADDFLRFNQNTLEGNRVIHAVSWNPFIPHSLRATEEQLLRERGLPPAITERGASGELVPAALRDDYIFVKYIVPEQGNEKAQSFNVGSVPNRREALARSARSGTAQMTQPIQLVQDTIHSKALLVFYPVYRQGTAELSLNNTLGFATAVIVTQELVRKMMADYGPNPAFTVTVDFIGRKPETLAKVDEAQVSGLAYLVRFEQTYAFAGETLRVTLEPTETFVAEHHSALTWTVLAGGFLFCALLGGFLLSLSVRSERIRELVSERTKELSSILNSATDAILTVDEQGRIHRYNPAALTLLATTDVQLKASGVQRWLELFDRNDEDVEKVLGAHLNATIETTLTTQNEQRLAVEVGVSQMWQGQTPHYVIMLHDITERKKTEKLKSEFVSTVSHELRTPLTSILGSLKLIQAGVTGDISDKTRTMVTIARNNTERLSVLVNDILDVEKLEFDQLKVEMTPVAIVDTIQHAVQQMEGYANGFDVELVLDIAENITMEDRVQADAHRVIQVVTNLMSNAVKYSDAGGQVVLSLSKEVDEIVISVKDHGRGMPEYFRKHIFQKFSQVDSTDKREKSGTGLGLYIVKALTEKMQGSISFESELGKGSKFFVRFPIYNPKD